MDLRGLLKGHINREQLSMITLAPEFVLLVACSLRLYRSWQKQ